MDNLDNLLSRGDGTERLLSISLYFNVGNELLDYLEVNIGFQKRTANLFQGLPNI